MVPRLLLPLVLTLYLCGMSSEANLYGQGDQSPASTNRQAQVPVTTGVPTLDGVLDDEVWNQAVVITDFIEVDPVEGRRADPQTEFLLMRSADVIYVGVRAWEPEPDKMVLQNMRRDAFLNDDDRVEFIFDTFSDTKTTYFFQLSAAGSRGDALLGDNGSRFNKRWDTFWDAEIKIHENRWVAEVAIPARAIAFSEDGIWLANFERYRGVDRSRSRWSGASRSVRVGVPSEAGQITGMTGLEQGLGMEFVPYFKVKASKSEGPERTSILGTAGGEFNWRITPQLTGSFTFNTDFAETESDERRVNLTRFPLFFPEKRDFFLEDSNLFDFGARRGFRGSPDVLPFFSRRIGLSPDGNEVTIDGGARLAGRIDDLSLGLLAVQTGDLASENIPDGQLFVMRPSVLVSEGLSVGGLFTHGNPASDDSNTVMGADVRYDTTDWLPGNFSFTTFVVRSSDEGIQDRGYANGMQASYQVSDADFSLSSTSAQGAFEPALGFVRRPGERKYSGRAEWRPRTGEGSSVRNYEFEINPTLWTDLSGDVQSYRVRVEVLGIEWHDGDDFSINVVASGDNLENAFEPVDRSRVPAGNYDWQDITASYEFSEARPLSAEIAIGYGSWYNGHLFRIRAEASYRPNGHWRIGIAYDEDQAMIPGPDFATRVGILNADFSFSSNFSLENLIQLDNESDILGLQSRLRYIQSDGRELFVVVNSAWQERPGGMIVPTSRDVTAKIVYSLRF